MHTGIAEPLDVTAAYFSIVGCTDPNDIKSLRIFSQNGSPLDDNDLMFTVDKPTGVVTITTPSGTKVPDVKTIWVAYDLEFGAGVGDSFDLAFDSAVVDGIMRYASTPNPAGNTFVVHPASYTDYCDVVRGANGSYAIGIRRVKFETIDNKTATLVNGFLPNNTCVQFYTTPIPTVYRNVTYPITLTHGELNTQSAAIFIDYDNDGYFSASERIKLYTGLSEASETNDNITIACASTTGIHRMRIAADYGAYVPSACGSSTYGEVEDYLIYIAPEETPVVTVHNADTGYVDGLVVFTPELNLDGDLLVLWDYDNNSTIDDTAAIGKTYFGSTGSKTVAVTAILRGCYDTLTSQKAYGTINIITPSTVPNTNFIADKNIVIPNTTINFTDLTTLGPNSWTWKITPDSVDGNPAWTYLTSNVDQNPIITFNELGIYTVELTTVNAVGPSATSKTDYISVIKEETMCSDMSSRSSTGYLYDNGGPSANYTNPVSGDSYVCSYLIKPDCATSVTLDFLDFDVASNTIGGCNTLPSDGLRVYDGMDATGTPLHANFLDAMGDTLFPNGFTNGDGNASIGIPPSVTATTGKMYVEFFVNCGAVGKGFEAKWSSQIYTPQAPVASIGGEDTIYRNQTAYLRSTSTGDALEYNWDMDNDGWADLFTKDVSWQYTTAGTHTITLTIISCGQTDQTTFDLYVEQPTSVPLVDFTSNYTNVTLKDPVTFYEDAGPTVFAFHWEITPSTFSIVEGDFMSSPLQVQFHQLGFYTVKLVAENGFGKDSLIKVDYINVYEPCLPLVGNLNSDVGISEFSIQNSLMDTLIHQHSTIGVSGYTDYSTTQIATLQKGGKYTFFMNRMTNFNKVTRSIFIDFNQDGDFIDAGEEVAMQYNSSSLSWSGSISIPNTVQSGLAKMRIAANAGQLYNKGCGPNFSGEFEDYGLEIFEDMEVPVITLYGANPKFSNSCATYLEPGFTAWDVAAGDLTSQVIVTGSINPTVADTYDIKYNVCDPKGNCAIEVIRQVIVLPDTVKPKIEFGVTKNPDSIAVGNMYTDPGYTPTDNCSGVKFHSYVNNVDGSTVGWYSNVFYIEDNAGNKDTFYRDVYVYDDIDPTIQLLGADPIYVEVGTTFTDPGADPDDNYYKNLSYEVIGKVDMTKLGTYFLSYCVTDSSGNGPVCVDRTVIVEDTEAPDVTLLGDNPYELDVFENFKDPGVDVTDNYSAVDKGTIIVTKTGTVNSYKLGTYTITYKATDESGNTSTPINRTVEVIDQVAPSIELIGNTTVIVERWQEYVDAGITVNDNYDSKLDVTKVENEHGSYPGNTLEEGLFTFTWSACDLTGNCSEEIWRTVYVVPSTSSIDEVELAELITFYPNPADREITVNIDLPSYANITLNIFNTLGEQVMDVFEGYVRSGSQQLDVSNLSEGIYYLRITAGDTVVNKKFIVVR
ncbi:immunoglobulin-like domain-containing protein [Bacteroidota bacterium]